MLPVKKDHLNHRTMATMAHRISKDTIGIPRVISTEEGEADHQAQKTGHLP